MTRRSDDGLSRNQRREAARRRLARGEFTLPSPDEVARVLGPSGAGASALDFAEWGIAWPPYKGWRFDLERRWYAANPGAQLRVVETPPERSIFPRSLPAAPPSVTRPPAVADMPRQMPRPSTLEVLAKIRALHDFDLLMLLTDIERRGLREAVEGFGLVPKADVTSRCSPVSGPATKKGQRW